MNMDELAKMAGVSKGAVSLTLNGKPGVGQETRERILRLAQETGYMLKGGASTRDGNGKSLRFLVFTNAGLVHDDYYQQPFFRELIHHIEERCRFYGYSLIFSVMEESHYKQGIRSIMEDASSGIILLGTSLARSTVADLADKLSSLVILDTCYPSISAHFVEINNFMGAYQAATRLAALRHRHIGYIASEERIHNFDERKRGFLSALAEYGLNIVANGTLTAPPNLLSSQEVLLHKLKQMKESGEPFPTAFFCECDYLAIGTMKALTSLGLSVPSDVSIIGFDNINESLVTTPELTTVHVDKERMAQLAVDLLISPSYAVPSARIKLSVDTLFVERASCREIGN